MSIASSKVKNPAKTAKALGVAVPLQASDDEVIE